jgi:hypothetical protein
LNIERPRTKLLDLEKIITGYINKKYKKKKIKWLKLIFYLVIQYNINNVSLGIKYLYSIIKLYLLFISDCNILFLFVFYSLKLSLRCTDELLIVLIFYSSFFNGTHNFFLHQGSPKPHCGTRGYTHMACVHICIGIQIWTL